MLQIHWKSILLVAGLLFVTGCGDGGAGSDQGNSGRGNGEVLGDSSGRETTEAEYRQCKSRGGLQ